MRMRMKQRLRRATETVRLQTLTRDACWTAASTRAPTEPTADDLPQDASLSPDAVPLVFSLDRCHTCDFIARFCRTSARLYRATKSQTLRLSSCTLRLRRVNKHGFCANFPASRSSFTTNTAPKWRNCSISNLFLTLRLIVRFRCARQPTKAKISVRIS